MSVITLTGSISVGNALLEAMPSGVPAHVEDAAKYLAEVVGEAEEGLTDRLDGKADTALERSFDVLVDRIWVTLRARLEFWHIFNHEGIALLNAEEQAEVEIEKHRKLAEVAKELLARLFGSGVQFLQLPYPQQAAHMAARLRYVDNRGLQNEFKELVGVVPDVLARVCQRRYEAMVTERAARDQAVNVNLRPLRAKIAWAAENYAALLISTLPKGNEEWAKRVMAALQPMVATDGTRANSSAESAEDEAATELDLGGELVDADQPALLEEGAEQG